MRISLSKPLWFAVSIASFTLVIASIVMTDKLNLHPCHLCILQRILFMILGLFSLLAALGLPRLFGSLTLLTSFLGIGVSGYQVWLQAQPSDPFSCSSGTPEWAERLVDWLGNQAPDLFLATGLCQEVELTILKVSLAGWALIAFASAAFFAIAALLAGRRSKRWF